MDPNATVAVNPYATLEYARGYLLTRRKPRGVPSHWRCENIGVWRLYHDPRCAIGRAGSTLILGHAVRLDSGVSDLESIAGDIESARDHQDILDRLAGRFIVIRGEKNSLAIQQDAGGLRAAYYSEAYLPFIMASHEHLAALQASSPTNQFSGSYLTRNGMQCTPGNATTRLGIIRLLPNTELYSATRKLRRIFPRHQATAVSSDYAAEQFIRGAEIQIASVPPQTPLIASLSAGLDSRVTLALLRRSLETTTFFTYSLEYQEKNEWNMHDRTTATALASQFGLHHQMLDIYEPVKDEAFHSLMNRISSFSHSRAVARAYLDHLPLDALHLRSNLFGVARGHYRSAYYRYNPPAPTKIEPRHMRDLSSHGKSEDQAALDEFTKYYTGSRFSRVEALGYDGLDIFLWEHRIGNWMTPILHESDIAHDTHILLNSRSLLSTLLSVPLQDRLDGTVFMRVIERLWPELLEIPVNGRVHSRRS